MTKGLKYDTGKATFWRALRRFPKALAGAARAGDYGFEKYCRNTGLPDDNWKSIHDAEKRYFDALMRHWLAVQEGETHDAESGLSHWDHFAWNALALAQMGHDWALIKDEDDDDGEGPIPPVTYPEISFPGPTVAPDVKPDTKPDWAEEAARTQAKVAAYMTQRRSEQEASPPKPMTTKA